MDRQRLKAFFESDTGKRIDRAVDLSFKAWLGILLLFICLLAFLTLLVKGMGYGEPLYKDVLYIVQIVGTVATVVALVLGMANRAPLNFYSWGFGISSILTDKGTEALRFYTTESVLASKGRFATAALWIQAVGVSVIMALTVVALGHLAIVAVARLRQSRTP
ncbi:hypothetical protein DEDE109153_18030 [Deinococcus deserti]|uniref:Uncharacterized protein n=1 Tax=Deinococcus deserti (strain DSM 17065 / CIP 109153 / LMG 22923 / VCD115) TaxID=546414 RepID=C1CZ64_DEIDV|nr:hypothetical protein [Deinococcus deserti]ACO45102.2 Hypothetical protein; putative membrane protein [Deinococcus deserti VCD115]